MRRSGCWELIWVAVALVLAVLLFKVLPLFPK